MLELILPQEILQLQGSSHADQYKASSSNCSPCLQASYTAETAFQVAASIASTLPTTIHPRTLQRQVVPGHSKDKLSQDNPNTTCPRTIQGYNSFPIQLIPGQYRVTTVSKGILPRQPVPGTQDRTVSQDNSSQDNTEQDFPRQFVPRHINKIYGVSGQSVLGQESLHNLSRDASIRSTVFQDNQSQDRNHYVQNSTRIHFKRVKYCISMQY